MSASVGVDGKDIRVFSHFLVVAKHSDAQSGLASSFRQQGTVKLKISESDFCASVGWHYNVPFTCRMQVSGGHIVLK